MAQSNDSRRHTPGAADTHSHDHGEGGEHPHVHAFRLLSREDCARIDRLAIEQYGMSSIVLMENAGRSIADFAAPILFTSRERPSILILAGPGNNGGDGFVVARHLANLGARVGVITSEGEGRTKGDALANLSILKKMGIPIRTFDPAKPRAALSSLPAYLARPTLVVDALLGTGFSGELREPIASMIELCNDLGDADSPILSIDLPSGLDADTGEPAASCVEADITVCLVSLKPGVLTEAGRPFCGEVVAGDIGIPTDLIERFGEVVEVECDHEHGSDEEDESEEDGQER